MYCGTVVKFALHKLFCSSDCGRMHQLAPGAPGWPGKAVSFGADAPVLLIWNPHEERHTSTYIDDPHWQASITAAGDECVDVLASKPWERERWPEVLASVHAPMVWTPRHPRTHRRRR